MFDAQGHITGEYSLEAVTSLPKDALQPYSEIQAHILLVSKRGPTQDLPSHRRVWLFQVETDGYPAGRARDLTAPPEKPNDLTFMEAVLLSRTEPLSEDQKFPKNNPLLGVKMFGTSGAGIPHSMTIEALGDANISLVEHFPANDKTPSFLLIQVVNTAAQTSSTIQVVLDAQSEIVEIDLAKEALIKQLYNPKNDEYPGKLLFTRGGIGQSIALTGGERLLGVTVSKEEVVRQSYELRPSQYIKAPEAPQYSEAPAVLLGRIRKTQRRFIQHIDGLLGRLELTPETELDKPSPVLEIEPFEGLSAEQEGIWKRVTSVSANSNDTAGLFTLDDIVDLDELESAKSVYQTLELLEKMGVIVAVTIVDPRTREPLSATFYRRITERDRWEWDK